MCNNLESSTTYAEICIQNDWLVRHDNDTVFMDSEEFTTNFVDTGMPIFFLCHQMTRFLRALGVVVMIDDSLQKRFFEKLATNRKKCTKNS